MDDVKIDYAKIRAQLKIIAAEHDTYLSGWAKQYFYKKLTEQGFLSYADQGLSWYKVVNHSILQTVYIYNGGSKSWITPRLGYGCHPLFITAPLPQKRRMSDVRPVTVKMTEVNFPTPKAPDPVFWVTSTKSPEAGAELLDEIVFPYFSQIHNEHDAYLTHRDYHKKRIEAYLQRKSWADYGGMVACRDFMDELIYFADWEMLKYCDRDLSPSFYREEKDRKHVDAQRAAIRDGKREEFLAMLDKRKKQFVKKLESEVGIKVELA